jgi:hypothetical protein
MHRRRPSYCRHKVSKHFFHIPDQLKRHVELANRMSLNMGGDDITEFLSVLLDRISFPYRDLNLARWYDWNVVEDLKARLCTLAEVRILSEDPLLI